MNEPPAIEASASSERQAKLLTRVLAASAALVVGLWLVMALSRRDTGPLESPLILPIARQLSDGPWCLYGPYDGRKPWVLIHAPLYYHLAGLLAWSLARARRDDVLAALAAGRSLSMLGLALTAAAAYQIARFEGALARAGVWTVLLVLTAPVVTFMSFTVRPDMLGIAAQTFGIALVLKSACSAQPSSATLRAGYACFAVAACTKQHFVMAALVSTGLLLLGFKIRRIPLGQIAGAVALFLTIVAVSYGVEEVATQGRMSRSVFLTAGRVGQIHPGGWLHVATVFSAVLGKSVGLLCLLAAAYLAPLWDQGSPRRKRLTSAAASAIAAIAIAAMVSVFVIKNWAGWLVLAGAVALALLIIPTLARCEPVSRASRLEAILWVYVACELSLMTLLCLVSDGAWVNYAIEAVVLTCVVTGRALARGYAAAPAPAALRPAGLAALAVLSSALLDLKDANSTGYLERDGLARSFDLSMPPRFDLFFVDRPGYNRLYGRLELVYDYWLYPVFESTGLAEPRSRWLRQALSDQSMRTVFTPTLSARIDGVDETLQELGYRPLGRAGPLLICQRDPAARESQAKARARHPESR
jgi:hypothetical protein